MSTFRRGVGFDQVSRQCASSHLCISPFRRSSCVEADFVSLIVVGFSQHGRVLDRALRSPVEHSAWHEEEAVLGAAGEVRDLDAARAWGDHGGRGSRSGAGGPVDGREAARGAEVTVMWRTWGARGPRVDVWGVARNRGRVLEAGVGRFVLVGVARKFGGVARCVWWECAVPT